MVKAAKVQALSPKSNHQLRALVYRPAEGAGYCVGRRLWLGGKRNTVPKVAEQRELPGVCPQKQALTGRLAPVPLVELPLVERCWR